MFTGIIEELGEVAAIKPGTASSTLSIAARKVLTDVQIGDSIAVNGVCLTVTTFNARQFSADVMPETMKHSTLGKLRIGQNVNLERALPADGRFGGHMVLGHIDGRGTITNIRKDDTAIWYTLTAETEVLKYMVWKGSVAIDGISLTIAALSEQDFAVSIIPHTAAQTTLAERRVGDQVNLETDIVARYVESFVRQGVGAGGVGGTGSTGGINAASVTSGVGSDSSSARGAVTFELLAKNGFLGR